MLYYPLQKKGSDPKLIFLELSKKKFFSFKKLGKTWFIRWNCKRILHCNTVNHNFLSMTLTFEAVEVDYFDRKSCVTLYRLRLQMITKVFLTVYESGHHNNCFMILLFCVHCIPLSYMIVNSTFMRLQF